ncbi:FadR/GntR family transcriptional regulator [Amphibacillus jilinensis]|uniref:FadR/GntR family transcriptional regulator n=1 Tax=Amphibacillus jilinensis TaxID=1216008 RepID=UPI00031F9716|nr:FCD domain-containing protein [Amphibacillus jilinensis]
MRTDSSFQFEAVSSKKVSDFILKQLEEAIILKELIAGEQLPTERELSSIFNASRLTIREALAELERRGLIERRLGAKGGTFVLPLTDNSHKRNRLEIRQAWDCLTKIFEYRNIIEPETAFLAARRMNKDTLIQLRDYLDKSMTEDCTREWFRSLDVRFHLTIAKASANHYFESAVREIRTKINPALDLMPYNQRVKEKNIEGHTDLLHALEKGDGERARELMTLHIIDAKDAIYRRVFEREIDR